MGLEFELKYRATAGDLRNIRAAFPGAYDVIPMTTSYYDTRDGALSRRKWTLRRRMEGERSVCTLKTPAGDSCRGEWEVECAAIEDAVPLLAEQAGLPELLTLTAGGLALHCGARFTRQALPLYIGRNTAELALDAGVLIKGTTELPFAEVEIELKSGSREEIAAFAAEFAEKFRLEPEPDSKFARARAIKEDTYGA